MRCIYCDKPVAGPAGITVPSEGPAHQRCFQADQALRRTFQNLDISALNDQELIDLMDLVRAETNARQRDHNQNDIELF